jgi:hypothetical protein
MGFDRKSIAKNERGLARFLGLVLDDSSAVLNKQVENIKPPGPFDPGGSRVVR